MPTVSVVIPTLNEAERVGELVSVLRPDAHEILVADGGSTDTTRTKAEMAGAIVLDAPRGRAWQMNAAAARASGNVLLFLHADTTLPADWPRHVRQTLSQPHVSAGAFRFKLDAVGPTFGALERLVNFRSRWLQLPYGDQAIFLRRDTFEQLGGYREMPILEDVDLIRRTRKLGRIGMAAAAAVTSARRWRQDGVVYTTLLNQACLIARATGMSPTTIARWRRPLTHRPAKSAPEAGAAATVEAACR